MLASATDFVRLSQNYNYDPGTMERLVSETYRRLVYISMEYNEMSKLQDDYRLWADSISNIRNALRRRLERDECNEMEIRVRDYLLHYEHIKKYKPRIVRRIMSYFKRV